MKVLFVLLDSLYLSYQDSDHVEFDENNYLYMPSK